MRHYTSAPDIASSPSTRIRCRAAHCLGLDAEFGSFVEPDVFHAPAVVDAVDHNGQAPELGVPTIAATAEIKHRLGVVLDEAALDLPDDALAFFLVRLPRLLLDHPVDLG